MGRREEPRMTLGGYLDMSRSLNMDPISKKYTNTGRKSWDMTKSLNVEPGFFAKSTKKKKNQGGGSTSGSSSSSGSRIKAMESLSRHSPPPVLEEEEEAVEPRRRSNASAAAAAAAKSPLSGKTDKGFPARNSFHAGLNGRVLPASPNVRDAGQEKELIEAFVDQLRSIAASSSSSEPNATTRRVVRRALEFSSSLITTSTPEHSGGTTTKRSSKGGGGGGGGGSGGGGDDHDLTRRLYGGGSKLAAAAKNTSDVPQRRRQMLPAVVEEKQTVISSPICHGSSSISRIKLKSVDMCPAIQQHAIECSIQLLRNMDCKLNCKLVAWQLKKEFDKVHGPAWHCIVGTSFGSYVTHSVGGFVYFAVGKVSILLFRTAIQVVDKK